MILRAQPGKPWDDWDFLLLEAYQILEEERCPRCGLPRYICHSDNPDLIFEVDEDECQAMAAKERHEKRLQASTSRNKPADRPGVALIPRPVMVSGAELASLREPYYKAEAEKRKALDGD